jgi:hypothetical protein
MNEEAKRCITDIDDTAIITTHRSEGDRAIGSGRGSAERRGPAVAGRSGETFERPC